MWLRVGVEIAMKEWERKKFELLCKEDPAEAEKMLLELLRSKRAELSGETYIPEMEDMEFNF